MSSKLFDRLSLGSRKSSSKSNMSATSGAAPSTPPQPTGAAGAAAEAIKPKPSVVAKIAVIVYSLYGHQITLSRAFLEGLKQDGVECTLYQFEDILTEETRQKMHADTKGWRDLPVITTNILAECDGFVIAAGARHGRVPASVSAFFDRTGGLWAKGALVGKMATMITGTGSQHGGVETTALTTRPFFAHQGIIYVPLGFTSPEMFETGEIIGASAYGAATITGGDGHLQPTQKDEIIARAHGKLFGKTVLQFVRGKE